MINAAFVRKSPLGFDLPYLVSGEQVVPIDWPAYPPIRPQGKVGATKSLVDIWPELPRQFQGGVDAAFETKDRGMALVQGGRYWTERSYNPSSPPRLKDLVRNLPGSQYGIDAGCRFGLTNDKKPRYLYFSGDQVLLEGFGTNKAVSIADCFPGLPVDFEHGIDAAMSDGSAVYLFRGHRCYSTRPDVRTLTVEHLWPHLPARFKEEEHLLLARWDKKRENKKIVVKEHITAPVTGEVHEPDVDEGAHFGLKPGGGITLRCAMPKLKVKNLKIYEHAPDMKKGRLLNTMRPGQSWQPDDHDAAGRCTDREVNLYHVDRPDATEERKYFFGITFAYGSETEDWDPMVHDEKGEGK